MVVKMNRDLIELSDEDADLLNDDHMTDTNKTVTKQDQTNSPSSPSSRSSRSSPSTDSNEITSESSGDNNSYSDDTEDDDGDGDGDDDNTDESDDDNTEEDDNEIPTHEHKHKTHEILLIKKENIEVDDIKIMEFVNFCIDTRLFDNTFYDYGNAFSVMATKLPHTFDKLTKDGESITKDMFVTTFVKEYKYPGDIEYVYRFIDEDKNGCISWDEFVNFFVQFVVYISI